jgi:hypothetical protein
MNYHVATFQGRVIKTYTRKHHAEKLMEKLNRESTLNISPYIVMDDEQLHNAMQDEVEVVNLMSKEITRIPAYQRGNPAADVSMEGYWSM